MSMRHEVNGCPVVRVVYIGREDLVLREAALLRACDDPDAGWALVWPDATRPRIGAYAWDEKAPGGSSKVAVIGFGSNDPGELRTLTRTVPGVTVQGVAGSQVLPWAAARRASRGWMVCLRAVAR